MRGDFARRLKAKRKRMLVVLWASLDCIHCPAAVDSYVQMARLFDSSKQTSNSFRRCC
jgi:hypothetical protein